ncbi:MAG: hypothetical protein KAJ10_14975, partial [Thermodesulfovibrionia bacterium]|nr:hypothetical protein [Thermodesulfovibrionia bacterium]
MSFKKESFSILFISSQPTFSLAAAFFYENIKKKFTEINIPRFIVRDYSRVFSEVNSSFIRDILLYRPDIIGFSCFFWNFDSNVRLSEI